jgi:hypothetical protein
MYMLLFEAENVAKKMNELIKCGPHSYPALTSMIANGEAPARLSAVKRSLSIALTLMPAKNIMPQ